MPAKILVVDDEPDIRELLSDILGLQGHESIHAGSGEEALEILEKEQFDLIIMDIMMPGMGGMKACEKIKEKPGMSHIPVLMLTAKHEMEFHLDAITVSADEYLTKPFDSERLMRKVSEHLAKAKERDAGTE